MAQSYSTEKKCLVSLGFDVDGVTWWVESPEYTRLPSLMSMSEYGTRVAVPRILKLLDEYDIKASFYVPGYIVDNYQEMTKEIFKAGHEVAHHGYNHESPSALDRNAELEVLNRGIASIERVTGEKPRGYRAPSWELSESTLSLLASLGFRYDSSMMDEDVPYELDTDSGKLLELPITWILDDFPFFGYAPTSGDSSTMASPDQVYNVWASEFEGAYRFTGCFVLTMHPQVIGRPGRMLMLERLIKHIRSFPNVEFVRSIDLVEAWMARS